VSDMTEENKIDDEHLRALARYRIEQNLLPREKPVRMWGGRGTSLPCSLCDQPILETEPEMELEYESAGTSSATRFHLRCQSMWDVARQALKQSLKPSQWIPVAEEMPPLHTVVEARLSLGGTRAVILNIMRVCDGNTGPVVWLNATTNGQLPDAWEPVEWRDVAGQPRAGAPIPVSSPSPRLRA